MSIELVVGDITTARVDSQRQVLKALDTEVNARKQLCVDFTLDCNELAN